MANGQDWVAREWRAAIGQRPDPRELGQVLSQFVAPRVAHDALRLIASHPLLSLETGAFSIWRGYESGLGQALLLSEYRGDDPWSPRSLGLHGLPCGVVGDPVSAWARHPGNHDGKSVEVARGKRVTREVFTANGAGGELRLLLRDSRGTWGMLGLLRAQGGIQFTQRDIEKLTGLTSTLISAVRVLATTRLPIPSAPAPPPGVIVLDREHRTKAVTPQVQQWQQLQVAPEACGSQGWAFTSMSLAVRRRIRNPRAPLPMAYAPPICFGGRWVTVQGQPLDSDGTSDVAIVIQAAGLAALPAFCEWYGITARERAVVRELCTGSAPKQIARLFDLSPHTVNDHLKSVYLKTGAGGRGELMAMLTA